MKHIKQKLVCLHFESTRELCDYVNKHEIIPFSITTNHSFDHYLYYFI